MAAQAEPAATATATSTSTAIRKVRFVTTAVNYPSFRSYDKVQGEDF
jgi:hypothetical protein